MIIDIQKFVASEKKHWEELESFLRCFESDLSYRADVDQLKRFHYLYEKVSSDLDKISTFASEKELRRYLESLVARAYSEIHEARGKRHRFSPWHWFFYTFPQTFRRQFRAFALSLVVTMIGFAFGALAIALDPDAKEVLMPFPHLIQSPSERVAKEESGVEDRLEGHRASFSAQLMTHNTQVSVLVMALGVTWGLGTIILLFYNGVILGAVSLDYMLAGQTSFLLGWLLPHGVIEIPAILIGGQAGLILARALIGQGQRKTLRVRLREISNDLTTLIGGVAILLVWAGLVESFLSQYHEPVLPYSIKIALGVAELLLLVLFLSQSGKTKSTS